ncbi:MAG: hypothetical protein KDJ39_08180 [Gammaproteobacteria bacterium]|nr:hypothetical protein [Gammaproteobacteria bacterium]MCP5298825.1 hypothetical protein [Chromatiaceae bacterium]
MKLWLILASGLLLAACADISERLQSPRPLVKPPASVSEAEAIARDLARRGRWSEGQRYLDAAALSFGNDPALVAARERLAEDWLAEERIFEDRILVGDAENLRNKVQLLEKLSMAQPDDLVITSRRIFWKEKLAGKVEPLTQCAETHVMTTPQLAKRCFEIASWLPADAGIEARLTKVDEELRTIESVAAERRRAKEARERQARSRVLMDNAKAAIDAHDYRQALDTLDEVSKLQPNNAEVAGLREEALSMISPQIEALIKLGDHLYLDEQLEAAVATWQAALTLKPQDEDIVARIERAKTVLSKLETLRRRQNGSVPPGE